MGGKKRMPLGDAVKYAQRFCKRIDPYTEKYEIAGSVRRLCETVGDVEIVCLDNPLNSMENLFVKGKFRGMVMNGKRLKRFIYPASNLQVELYITSPEDYGRMLAIRTGSSAYSRHILATTWNRNGWCGGVDGLRRKKECDHKGKKWVIKPEFAENPTKPPVFTNEYDFFDFLELNWRAPQYRNMVSRDEEYNYST